MLKLKKDEIIEETIKLLYQQTTPIETISNVTKLSIKEIQEIISS